MNQGKTTKQTGPRLSKMPQLHDFQFYNTARLTELYEKDHAYEIYKHQVPRGGGGGGRGGAQHVGLVFGHCQAMGRMPRKSRDRWRGSPRVAVR